MGSMKSKRCFYRCALAGAVSAFVSSMALLPSTAMAEETLAAKQAANINIQAQPIGDALSELAKHLGIQVTLYSEVAEGIQSKQLTGNFSTVREAIDQMLSGTGLTYRYLSDNTVMVYKQDGESEGESAGKPSREEAVEEVVVTGSRIARNSSQLAANTVTLSASDLKATGASTLEGALRQLPQNVYGASPVGAALGSSFNGAVNLSGASSINLRGLGSESTLVLINGRKMGKSGVFGGISDITGIPLSSIDRVEIMLDGASAIYGSDAIGGVVNIITKKDYEGSEIKYEYGRPENGGFEEHIFSATGSKSWDGGQIRATFEHFTTSNLGANERPESIAASFTADSPATLSAGWQQVLFYNYQGQNYLPSELPVATTDPDVTAVTRSQLPAGHNGVGLSVSDFTVLSVPDVVDQDADFGKSLIPATTRNSLQIGFDHDLTSGEHPLTVSGNFYYSERETHAEQGVFTLTTPVAIPAGQAYNPFETSVSVFWEVPELGARYFDTDQTVWRWNIELSSSFGETWKWSAAAGQTEDKIDSMQYGNSISTRLISGGQPTEFAGLVDQGLSLFVGNLAADNDPELVAQLAAAPLPVLSINSTNYMEFSTDGTLFSLPAGDVRIAVGGEWRQEILETGASTLVTASSVDSSGGPSSSLGFDSTEVSRTQQAAFLEAYIPLIGDEQALPGVESLALTGAARYDTYDQFGGESTWSLGMVWDITSELRAKVNHSTSYVVPTPRDALIDAVMIDNGTNFGVFLYDENGQWLGQSTTDFAETLIVGGNPDLEPETASTLSASLQYEPEWLSGLTLSATWHQTEYDNRISPFPGQVFVYSPLNNETIYPDNIYRNANGNLVYDARPTNLAVVDTSGVDYRVFYTHDTDYGNFFASLDVAYTDKYDRVDHIGADPVNLVKSTGLRTQRTIPEYRYSSTLGWNYQGASIYLNMSTSSDTESLVSGGSEGTLLRENMPALLANVTFSYDTEQGSLFEVPSWLENTEVSLRVLNILDDSPEYKVTNAITGEPGNSEFNPNLADPRGRMFYISATKRF